MPYLPPPISPLQKKPCPSDLFHFPPPSRDVFCTFSYQSRRRCIAVPSHSIMGTKRKVTVTYFLRKKFVMLTIPLTSVFCKSKKQIFFRVPSRPEASPDLSDSKAALDIGQPRGSDRLLRSHRGQGLGRSAQEHPRHCCKARQFLNPYFCCLNTTLITLSKIYSCSETLAARQFLNPYFCCLNNSFGRNSTFVTLSLIYSCSGCNDGMCF